MLKLSSLCAVVLGTAPHARGPTIIGRHPAPVLAAGDADRAAVIVCARHRCDYMFSYAASVRRLQTSFPECDGAVGRGVAASAAAPTLFFNVTSEGGTFRRMPHGLIKCCRLPRLMGPRADYTGLYIMSVCRWSTLLCPYPFRERAENGTGAFKPAHTRHDVVKQFVIHCISASRFGETSLWLSSTPICKAISQFAHLCS